MNQLDHRVPRSHVEHHHLRKLNGTSFNVDISALLSGSETNERPVSPPRQSLPSSGHQIITPPSQTAPGVHQPHHSTPITHGSRPIAPATRPTARRSMPTPGSEQPAKKQSKWSAEEDAIIIELRGSGMKWEDISKHLPGRSAISCRLHYQNYLERRSEWDEERKDKLATLYERFKSDMWAKVAEELQVPWRAAEAMHWQLGELDMAKRAGTTPFSLAAVNAEANAANRRGSPSRSQPARSRSQLQTKRHESVPRDTGAPASRVTYTRSQPPAVASQVFQPMTSRRDTAPPPQRHEEHAEVTFAPMSSSIPPLQHQEQGDRERGTLLPSIAELTGGIPPYRAAPFGPSPGLASHPSPEAQYHGQGYTTPNPGYAEPLRVKRPASPEDIYGESSTRRRMG